MRTDKRYNRETKQYEPITPIEISTWHNAHWTAKWFCIIDRMTLLCCISAHSKGKIHAKKKKVPTMEADGRMKVIELTYEDQLRIIGDSWKEFEPKEESA